MIPDHKKGSPADGFYPCNAREAHILRSTPARQLERYIMLRNKGMTLTQACKATPISLPAQ